MDTNLEYYEIAKIQLEKAIDLFFSEDYLCALTLAGAAEEILGSILKIMGVINIQDTIIKSAQTELPKLSYRDLSKLLNHSKNSLKHILTGEGEVISIKPVDDSLFMIFRAIANYGLIFDNVSQKMHDFLNDKTVKIYFEKIQSDLNLTESVLHR